MTRLQGWVLVCVLVVALGLMAGTQIKSGLHTFVPATRSVTSARIADGAIGYNPLQYDRGTRLDTPYVAICFDDGKDIWDSVKVWVDGTRGELVFSFGIPYNIVVGGSNMTAAEVQEAFSMGCEITNHLWTGTANYLSRIGDTGMSKVIDRSVAYFLDTLKVGIPGVEPLQIGANYAAGDITEWGRLRVAERHVYGTGLMASATTNQFENDSSVAVKCNNTFLRWNGNFLGAYLDTIQVSAYHGNGSGGATSDRVLRSSSVIWPNSIPDHYRVPACYSHGPSPRAGAGTIQQITEAKAGVRLAMRHGAATTFFFHHWDSVYTDGDPAKPWMSDFCAFLKEKEDSGLIKVVNVWDICRDYVLRPVASDWNFFPDPMCTTFSWDGNPNRADGWMYGGVWDTGRAWHVERGTDMGFDADTVCASWQGSNGHILIFARAVPPDCYVTFSCLVNASEGSADSVHVQSWMDIRTNDWRNQVGNAGQNQPATDVGYSTTSLVRVVGSDRISGSVYQPIGIGGYPDGYQTYSQGAVHACRYLWGGNSWDKTKWKELICQEYIPYASVVIVHVKQAQVSTFAAGEGIRFAHVSFTVKRRLGQQPVRY